MDIVKAKLDVVFKKLFTSDDDMLRGFLADILEIPKSDIKATPRKDRPSGFARHLLASFPSSCTNSP